MSSENDILRARIHALEAAAAVRDKRLAKLEAVGVKDSAMKLARSAEEYDRDYRANMRVPSAGRPELARAQERAREDASHYAAIEGRWETAHVNDDDERLALHEQMRLAGRARFDSRVGLDYAVRRLQIEQEVSDEF